MKACQLFVSSYKYARARYIVFDWGLGSCGKVARVRVRVFDENGTDSEGAEAVKLGIVDVACAQSYPHRLEDIKPIAKWKCKNPPVDQPLQSATFAICLHQHRQLFRRSCRQSCLS